MPAYFLMISGDLENLTDLQPQGGCDDPSYTYYFHLKCENCGEPSERRTCVALSEVVPAPTGRDTVHLVQKCKLCSREGTIKMIPGYGKPLTSEMSESGEPAKLMLFECRGFEPTNFHFGDGWKAESSWGTKFDVNLSEEDIVDYDEKGEAPVGISNMKGIFKVAQKRSVHGRFQYS